MGKHRAPPLEQDPLWETPLAQMTHLPLTADPGSRPPWIEVSGHCFFCWQPLMAVQPGGHNVEHAADGVPYGECLEAIKARTLEICHSRKRKRS